MHIRDPCQFGIFGIEAHRNVEGKLLLKSFALDRKVIEVLNDGNESGNHGEVEFPSRIFIFK